MTDANEHHRSIRLCGYDYSREGLYFVTVCVHHKACQLGSVHGESVKRTVAGEIAWIAWLALPGRFAYLRTDSFVVMPNHVHGVLVFLKDQKEGAASSAPTARRANLGAVLRAFRSLSAVAINRALGRTRKAVWQRNYYEHIIRDGKELLAIQQYIAENPLRWSLDRENPTTKVQAAGKLAPRWQV